MLTGQIIICVNGYLKKCTKEKANLVHIFEDKIKTYVVRKIPKMCKMFQGI